MSLASRSTFRWWEGLNSHKATTTAVVAEVDIEFDDYVTAIESSLAAGGWMKHLGSEAPAAMAEGAGRDRGRLSGRYRARPFPARAVRPQLSAAPARDK